jgi:general stress protein 26
LTAQESTMSARDPTENIWRLMREIGVAMVVTHSGEGDAVRARPMSARTEADDGAVYFLTDAEAPKDEEIANNSNICLAFADPRGQRYVSVTGTAEVFAGSQLAERIWRTTDKAFWNDANDPRIRVIRVTPEQGEYWEGTGFVASVVSMLVAGANGGRPQLGEGAKVEM